MIKPRIKKHETDTELEEWGMHIGFQWESQKEIYHYYKTLT
jgi:hypothetical protein